MELTILMPCLDEAETIETCVRKAKSFLERSGIDGEVLVSDNGSTDGSQALAKASGARVVQAPEKGYGASLLTGIEQAKGKYIIMGDSDDSYDFSALAPFVERLRDGADLVMGNRFAGGIEKNAMPPLHRYLGNPVLSFLGRIFYRTPVGDFHCGLRGFNTVAIRALKLNTKGMEFASEMIIKSAIMNYRIEEVPTTLSPDGRSRPPHLRSWRDGWLHLKLLMSLAPHWLFWYPGATIFSVGFFLFSMLIFGPVTIGAVTFDVAALVLACAAIITGAQMVYFYGLARVFAIRFGLLPMSPRFGRVQRFITVDNACIAGGGLLLMAILATVLAIGAWARAGFGDLVASQIARPAALAVVTASLGVQTITFGFLWGIMTQRLPSRRLASAEWLSVPGARAAAETTHAEKTDPNGRKRPGNR